MCIRCRSNYLYAKRFFDVAISGVALVLLVPIFIFVACLVRIESSGPALFIQVRAGKEGRLFRLYKFRSMKEMNKNGKELSDFSRTTTIGRLIRKTSIDELPQLINVLKGDMSLVGPRPLLPEYLRLYTREQMRRHSLLPGISGWAQVMGRNSLTWEEKFKLDVWYVDNISFLLDLKIILLTILKVINGIGINQNREVTMPSFKGTSEV